MIPAVLTRLTGHSSEAYGADPSDADKTYQFKYRVVDLNDLTPSHTDALAVNPNYPAELQPRIRSRAASRLQIENMAANLNPKVLLRDTGFLDTGPMIVGSDNVVESGNGRVLALRKAAQDYPAKYRLYRQMLINQADTYGFKDDEIEAMKTPVLVRERVTPVNRVKFAAEANTSNVLAMSPFEQAVQDAGRLSDSAIQSIEVGEDETIDQALRRKANAPIVAKFYDSIPANERASIVDAKGDITPTGMQRLKLALFTKTYQGDAGQRLARTFSESADPNVKNMEAAMFQSLPEMAKAESLIATGAREKELSIAPDMAEVIDTYSALKRTGTRVDDYLAQNEMFEQRLNPTQRAMLAHLDSESRSPKKIREFINDAAGQIVSAPGKGQGGMFGSEYEITKEKIINASINKQRKESGKEPLTATRAAGGEGLAQPHASGSGSAQTVGSGHVTAGTVQPGREETPALAPGTSMQSGLAGFGHEENQTQMFGEFSGKTAHKDTLVDVEHEKAKAAAKPLPGQTSMSDADLITVDNAIAAGAPIPERILKDHPKLRDIEVLDTSIMDTPKPNVRKRVRNVSKKSKSTETAKTSTPVEVPTVSLSTIIHHQNERKPLSRALDNAQQHRVVVPTSSPRVLRWLKDHGSMDVQGIDTKNAIPVSELKARLQREKDARISERQTGRLSPGGRGVFPLSRHNSRL